MNEAARRCLPTILVSCGIGRTAPGKAELGDDIRVLDGQCLLEVLPLTSSAGREELACAGPQPTVLHSASSIICAPEVLLTWSFITSTRGTVRLMPPFGSSFGWLPMLRERDRSLRPNES